MTPEEINHVLHIHNNFSDEDSDDRGNRSFHYNQTQFDCLAQRTFTTTTSTTSPSNIDLNASNQEPILMDSDQAVPPEVSGDQQGKTLSKSSAKCLKIFSN